MMYISNTRLFLFFKIWQQTSTADMLDLAVDHIRGLQSELQVCTVRDPLILSCYFFFSLSCWALFSLRGRYCHATLTRKSQLHCLKIEGEKTLEAVEIGRGLPWFQHHSGLIPNNHKFIMPEHLLFNQYHHGLYRIDQYATCKSAKEQHWFFFFFLPPICSQALKEDKEKCTCRGNHPSGR